MFVHRLRFLLILLPILLMIPVSAISSPEAYPFLEKEAGFVQTFGDKQVNLKAGNAETASHKFLSTWLSNNGENVDTLAAEHHVKSPFGHHLLFRQKYQGIYVYDASVKLNFTHDGDILSLFHKVAETAGWPEVKHGSAPTVQLPDSTILIRPPSPVIFIRGENTPHPAWKHQTLNTSNGENHEVILDENGRTLYQRDLNLYDSPEDSSLVPVQGKVFLPNPISSANVTYGKPYSHQNNEDVPELNAERFIVEMKVDPSEDDTLYLRGPHVRIKEFSPPEFPLARTTDSTFFYSRSESGFEETNAYYHIDAFQRYVQSLGFDSLARYPVEVDPHALGTTDNSFFNREELRIYLGFGGVPDAEDGDVIIHEYGHVLSHSAAPGTVSGHERRALEEGLSDYFACSYARKLQPDRWEDLMNWDGHNEFWSGRWCTTNRYYPEDIAQNIYADGEMWTGSLMEIQLRAGAETTDKLMMATLYSMASGMTLPDAAKVFLQKDSLLNNFENEDIIRQAFQERGFLESPNHLIADRAGGKNCSEQFTLPRSPADRMKWTIKSENPASGTVFLHTIQGHLISEQPFTNKQLIHLNAGDLPAGIYLLTVNTKNCSVTERILSRN